MQLEVRMNEDAVKHRQEGSLELKDENEFSQEVQQLGGARRISEQVYGQTENVRAPGTARSYEPV